METTLRGVGVSHGVAIGEVRHMGTAVLEPPVTEAPATAKAGVADRCAQGWGR